VRVWIVINELTGTYCFSGWIGHGKTHCHCRQHDGPLKQSQSGKVLSTTNVCIYLKYQSEERGHNVNKLTKRSVWGDILSTPASRISAPAVPHSSIRLYQQYTTSYWCVCPPMLTWAVCEITLSSRNRSIHHCNGPCPWLWGLQLMKMTGNGPKLQTVSTHTMRTSTRRKLATPTVPISLAIADHPAIQIHSREDDWEMRIAYPGHCLEM
jgi:hypothetical protein